VPERNSPPDTSEELRIVVGAVSAAVTRCSRDLTYIWVSQAYAEWLGRRVDDINGRDIAAVIGADALAAIRPYIDRVLAGERVEYEDEIEFSGPGRRRIHAIYIPTFDGSTMPNGWVAVIRDITLRRDAEQTVRESEFSRQLLAAIVESADDAIVSTDVHGIVTSWNDGAERTFGYAASEMVGRSIRRIIPDDRQSEEDHVLARIGRGERVEQFETMRIRQDSRVIPVSLRISPIRLASGEVVGASRVARDISEQKRAVEHAAFLAEVGAVLAASLEYETTLKTIANLAVPYIADWCTVDIVRGGLIERLAVAHVDPSKIAFVQQIRDRYQDPESPHSVRFVLQHDAPVLMSGMSGDAAAPPEGDDERMRLVRALGLVSYMSVPMTAHGRTLGALTFATSESRRTYTERDLNFARDIAHRAALAVENARAYEEARRADRLKDEFLATLSHELRTPLNAILGYSRMIRSGLVPPARQGKAIETIERNASALTQIVEDVLDVSRIISGKVRLDVRPVELPGVVEQAVESVMPAANAKQVHVHTTVDPHAAPVSGDPGRLQQVVWNLLSNAVKFTGRGGRVQVRVERINSHVEIAISDTGIGIAPEFLPHLFERFRQADAGTTRERGGLGLGLAIAKHLVEMHGGTIHATSQGLGTGATFIVRLPVMVVHREPVKERRMRPTGPPSEPGIPVPDLSGIRILAVDDDRDALNMVADILEAAGAEVSGVDSALDALNALKHFTPDLIVADIGMPRMDGFQFAAEVRKSSNEALRDVPMAALTAYARSEDRARSLRAGFQIHLAKPIDPAELMAAVASLVRRME
jgi:PAS domain S-box-containing protein